MAAILCAASVSWGEDAGVTGVHGYTPKGYVWPTEKAVLENIERNVQQVVLPPETTAGEIAKVVHLSSGRECPFEKTPDGWRVKLPAGVTYDLNADAFRLEFVR